MPTQMRHDDAKLRELILYIAERSAGDAFFGAVKLNKILFYSDFWAYGHFGTSITGSVYFRLPHGPAPRRLLPVKEAMLRDGDIEEVPVQRYVYTQKRIQAKRLANLDAFTAEQIALVEEVLEALRSHTALTASELSHDFIGWRLVEDGEEIPYEAVFLSDVRPDEEHLIRWRALAEEEGWEREAAPV
jgi:hypothetical protein